MGDLKKVLAKCDLASMSLDNIDGLDPQMARVLRNVQRWTTETVAHQNHSSHTDTHGEHPVEKEKAVTLRHAAE
jgi:hypothetical protein